MPRTPTEIPDRRNELSGNLSLYREFAFVETLDRLIDDGRLAPGGEVGRTVVRVVELPRGVLPRALGSASKLDRDADARHRLRASGASPVADAPFPAAWRHGRPSTDGRSASCASGVARTEPFTGRHRRRSGRPPRVPAAGAGQRRALRFPRFHPPRMPMASTTDSAAFANARPKFFTGGPPVVLLGVVLLGAVPRSQTRAGHAKGVLRPSG